MSLIESESPISEFSFAETFDEEKLCCLAENTGPLDGMRRANARNQVSLSKYLKFHYESRAGTVTRTGLKTRYSRNEKLKTRMQANGPSAQGMLREARHFIFNESYVDIDMVNAHPRIILQLCRELKIDSPCLEKYVLDRESILARCVSKDISNDRAYYKTLFLSLMYGKSDSCIKDHMDPFVREFSTEFKTNASKIVKSFPKFRIDCIEQRKLAGKDYNHEAACLSHLCQVFEAHFLENMLMILREKSPDGWNKSVLCFDGIMVHKDCFKDGFRADDYISICMNKINIPGTFHLEMKDMSSLSDKVSSAYNFVKSEDRLANYFKDQIGFEISKYKKQERLGFIHEPQTYISSFIESLYKVHAIWPSKELLIEYTKANASKYIANISSRSGEFLLNVSKDFTPLCKLPNGVVQFWDKGLPLPACKTMTIDQLMLRTTAVNSLKLYDCVQSHPFGPGGSSKCPDTIFNSFTGLRANLVPVKISSSLKAMLDHVRAVLANNDDDVYKYILAWFQAIFRDPSKITRKCLVFRSKNQQVGKGLFFNWVMEYVIGTKYSAKRRGTSFVTSNFNAELEHSIFNVCDEFAEISNHDSSKAVMDRFKELITEPTIEICEKRQTPRNVPNSNNWVILSNDSNPINVQEGDRRIFKQDCGEQFAGNTKYFKNLIKQTYNQKTADQFYSYVLSENFGVDIEHSPKTASYEKSKEQSCSYAKRFIKEISELEQECDDDEDEIFRMPDQNDPIEIIKSASALKNNSRRIKAMDLYKSFQAWSRANGIKSLRTCQSFLDNIEEMDCLKLTKSKGVKFVTLDNIKF